jgi:hypothetical protein
MDARERARALKARTQEGEHARSARKARASRKKVHTQGAHAGRARLQGAHARRARKALTKGDGEQSERGARR